MRFRYSDYVAGVLPQVREFVDYGRNRGCRLWGASIDGDTGRIDGFGCSISSWRCNGCGKSCGRCKQAADAGMGLLLLRLSARCLGSQILIVYANRKAASKLVLCNLSEIRITC